MTNTTPAPVYLHVGAMKTGTTYLQGLLFANQEPLREQGVLLPGGSFQAQVLAVREVLRMTHDDEHLEEQAHRAWDDVTAELTRPDHRVGVISMEFLSFARRRQVRRVVDSLPASDVHVVMTVRDTARLLPALWQTMVHSGSTLTWQELLDEVVAWRPGSVGVPGLRALAPAREDSVRTQLRRTADVPRMLRHWGSALRPGRLHVVTVPRKGSDPSLLWHRFAQVVGVDPAVATTAAPDANASIGYASTELVRRVNLVLPPLSRSEYLATIRAQLALTILAERRAEEGRAVLTAAAYDATLRANAAVHDAVAKAGAVLVGDPDDLPVEADADRRAQLPREAPAPSEDEVLDAAVLAVRGLRRLRDRRLRKLRRRGAELDPVVHPDPEDAAERWQTADDPVGAAAVEVAAWCHEIGLLLRERRRLRRQTTR